MDFRDECQTPPQYKSCLHQLLFNNSTLLYLKTYRHISVQNFVLRDVNYYYIIIIYVFTII